MSNNSPSLPRFSGSLLRISICLSLLTVNIGSAQADVRGQWGGFISQGWSRSTDNAFYGESADDGGSFDIRNVGLNGFVSLTPRLRINGQLLSRRAGRISDGGIEVDYLFADWAMLQQLDRQAGLRVGRIKHALGFANEARDVAFTRPGIIMPQSIYFDQVRELQLSSDGGALYYRTNTSLGHWLMDLQYGKLRVDDNTEARFLTQPREGGFNDSRVALGRIVLEPSGERWRFGLTFTDVNMPFTPAGVDLLTLTPGEIDLQMTILSAQYNLERWSFTAEAMQANTEWQDLGPLVPDRRTLHAFYLQADFRLTPRWKVMMRYDDLVFDKNDRNGKKLEQLVGLPAHTQYAKDLTFGARFQPTPSWDLAIEHHRVDGAGWLSARDNPDPAQLKRRWSLWLLQAAYRF